MNTRQLRHLLKVFCLTLTVALLAVACTPNSNGGPQVNEGLDSATVANIVGDSSRALLVTASGELWATGLNDSGQLGIAIDDKRLVQVDPKPPIVSGTPAYPSYNTVPGYLPNPIRVTTNVKQATISPHAGAYLTTEGELWVMGYESDLKYFPEVRQELANQTKGATRNDVVRPIKVMDEVKKVVGGWNILFLQENGDLFGTGDNHWGELGHAQMISDPLLIDQGVTDVFSGNGMTFYLKNDGELYGCGRNIWGELGFGEPLKVEGHPADISPTVRMNIPPQLIATRVQSVYSEGFSTLLLKTDGKLYMLGKNINNVYRDGSEYQTTPQLIAEDVRKMGIATLEWEEQALIILTNADQLLAWGSNLARLGVQSAGEQWAEIAADVKDFWTTPNLFVLTNNGQMRAAGPPADVNITNKDIGQLAGWSWD
jgi:alpha-tubulin suppressor-like RCC1 family protein